MSTNACRCAMQRLAAVNNKLSPRLVSGRLTNSTTAISTILPSATSRPFSASVLHDHSDHNEELELRMPVTTFTEDEEMVRNAARMWANQEVKPLVREMDNECKTRPEVIQGLFDQGFMGMVSIVWFLSIFFYVRSIMCSISIVQCIHFYCMILNRKSLKNMVDLG